MTEKNREVEIQSREKETQRSRRVREMDQEQDKTHRKIRCRKGYKERQKTSETESRNKGGVPLSSCRLRGYR